MGEGQAQLDLRVIVSHCDEELSEWAGRTLSGAASA